MQRHRFSWFPRCSIKPLQLPWETQPHSWVSGSQTAGPSYDALLGPAVLPAQPQAPCCPPETPAAPPGPPGSCGQTEEKPLDNEWRQNEVGMPVWFVTLSTVALGKQLLAISVKFIFIYSHDWSTDPDTIHKLKSDSHHFCMCCQRTVKSRQIHFWGTYVLSTPLYSSDNFSYFSNFCWFRIK